MKPLARSAPLLKQKVDEDMLVYDDADHMAYCLNPLASRIWQHCDGRHSIDDLATLVADDIDLPEGVTPADLVVAVLDELREHKLLSELSSAEAPLAVAPATTATKAGREPALSRRRALEAALLAAAVLPTITAILAPTTAMAESPAASGGGGGGGGGLDGGGTATPTPTPSLGGLG